MYQWKNIFSTHFNLVKFVFCLEYCVCWYPLNFVRLLWLSLTTYQITLTWWLFLFFSKILWNWDPCKNVKRFTNITWLSRLLNNIEYLPMLFISKWIFQTSCQSVHVRIGDWEETSRKLKANSEEARRRFEGDSEETWGDSEETLMRH